MGKWKGDDCKKRLVIPLLFLTVPTVKVLGKGGLGERALLQKGLLPQGT